MQCVPATGPPEPNPPRVMAGPAAAMGAATRPKPTVTATRPAAVPGFEEVHLPACASWLATSSNGS